MQHPAELAVHQYLDDATNNKTEMSEDTIDDVCQQIGAALRRQFGKDSTSRKDFGLRMSNVGRPYCQLWYAKNKPELARPKATTFVMNMMIGDIVEAVFKAVLTEAGVKYEDSEHVTLKLTDGTTISGTTDLSIDGAVDDIKSASNWSYRNKFSSYEDLESTDSFGYVGQLAGYAKASNKKVGGWWVINKATGEFKYVPASGLDLEEEYGKIETVKTRLDDNKFSRSFDKKAEYFRSVPTGRYVLGVTCGFCDYKEDCWPTLKELPSIPSKAKEPKIVNYVTE
mgnify:FL=1